ncbi:MAG: DUF488 domain-containing protein [Actinomycetota bacterium]
MIRVKRVYEPRERGDGKQFLVERLWPRGVKKEVLAAAEWVRDVAPSDELRRWFGHRPERWREFQRRYTAELNANVDAWAPLARAARRGTITLFYSARDTDHNNAVALKAYLDDRAKNVLS